MSEFSRRATLTSYTFQYHDFLFQFSVCVQKRPDGRNISIRRSIVVSEVYSRIHYSEYNASSQCKGLLVNPGRVRASLEIDRERAGRRIPCTASFALATRQRSPLGASFHVQALHLLEEALVVA
jgi:hypothetical protein